MKDRKELIIAKAMELYALKGYRNVSITDLQFALDMGRGTLYYYFKDQDELFLTCMEKYFLEPKQRALNSVPENVGIDRMIDTMNSYLESLEEALMTFDNKSINTSNVNDLMFTAYSLFPSLHNKAKRLALKELDLWRKAIYHDQRAGLIRDDIDREQIALMFTHIKNSYDNGLAHNRMNFSLLGKTYSEFHNLLKK
ncbi:MAG: TetR/AcrR family transcriptional regulator [Paludibacteraceae bacterium]|nr:TetR/AcrR family transcriptional regulator [Paludibacteraceae bacterium]MBQ6748165.1 TetR/AcrR family transcriptional regulator [Paludibacteraceae bacterium]MBQ6764394.1 TetR/AcrR family transcriptional regulator [Paludibacteraceae bacterium]MBR0064669.1 TetR/AcrR family transcriptional regulator [Paludibacteraceae bacterium]